MGGIFIDVKALWTPLQWRRQGFATQLLDTIRHFYIYSFVLAKERVRLAAATEDGKVFWSNYMARWGFPYGFKIGMNSVTLLLVYPNQFSIWVIGRETQIFLLLECHLSSILCPSSIARNPLESKCSLCSSWNIEPLATPNVSTKLCFTGYRRLDQ